MKNLEKNIYFPFFFQVRNIFQYYSTKEYKKKIYCGTIPFLEVFF